MAACRAAHEAEALEEVQACEMAGGRPHTIREEAGSGAMVAARSRLPSAVSLPVRDDSSHPQTAKTSHNQFLSYMSKLSRMNNAFNIMPL